MLVGLRDTEAAHVAGTDEGEEWQVKSEVAGPDCVGPWGPRRGLHLFPSEMEPQGGSEQGGT